MHRLSPELHMMFYWCLVLLSPMFDVKYKESFSYRVLVTEKFGKHVWRYSVFVTWNVNKLDPPEKSIVSSKRNFEHYWSKRRFPPRIFTSWQKFNEEASCSNEMSLKRPRTFDLIFTCTFDERSLERIMKFAVFRLHYFCKIL